MPDVKQGEAYQQVWQELRNSPESERTFTKRKNYLDFKKTVATRFGFGGPSSIIPTDYCYNNFNKSPESFKNLFFECRDGISFILVGPDAKVNGPLYFNQGSKQEVHVGNWRDGRLFVLPGAIDRVKALMAPITAKTGLDNVLERAEYSQ